VLAQHLDCHGGVKLTFEEIAEFEGISVDEIVKVYDSAILKLRKGSNTFTKTEEYEISANENLTF
jgi:hypothetical protein